jgi:hypothetical protein
MNLLLFVGSCLAIYTQKKNKRSRIEFVKKLVADVMSWGRSSEAAITTTLANQRTSIFRDRFIPHSPFRPERSRLSTHSLF